MNFSVADAPDTLGDALGLKLKRERRRVDLFFR